MADFRCYFCGNSSSRYCIPIVGEEEGIVRVGVSPSAAYHPNQLGAYLTREFMDEWREWSETTGEGVICLDCKSHGNPIIKNLVEQLRLERERSARLESKLERARHTIRLLDANPPPEGGIQYQRAKWRWEGGHPPGDPVYYSD